MENYRILKLKNGDSVIAGLGSITEKNTIILDRPMQFRTMTVMDDKTMGVRDYLLIRNWAEYSTDKAVEIPNDSILAILKPDEKLVMVYNLEKEKEDNPQNMEITPLNLPSQEMTDGPFPLQKMNIQLQLPPEASEQFLEMLGIEFEEIDDDDSIDDEDDLEDLDLEDDADFEPPPTSKRKTPSQAGKNKRNPSHFGNSPDDWSPDPSDYLK
jgi:hypothetical protein